MEIPDYSHQQNSKTSPDNKMLERPTTHIPIFIQAEISIQQQMCLDKCVLSGAQKTRKQLIHCNHYSRIQWKRRFIRTIRIRLTAMNTDDSLVEVIANCITEWMNTGKVGHTKYDDKYEPAITAQQQIG